MNAISAKDLRAEASRAVRLLIKGLGKLSLSDKLPKMLASEQSHLNYLRACYADEVDAYCGWLLSDPGAEAVEAEIKNHELFVMAMVWDRAVRVMHVVRSGCLLGEGEWIDAPDGITAHDVVVNFMVMGSGVLPQKEA